MKEYLKLFFTFARVGLFTFGGGYAMLPVLQREVVERNNWCTEEELTDMYAIGQCTPGVIMVNVSTYIGRKHFGVFGAAFATLGVVFPSLIIISLIASFLTHFAEYPMVQHAFAGIRIAVCALVVKTLYTMTKKNVKGPATALILVLTFAAVALWGISPVIPVLICGIIGALFLGDRKGANS